MVTWKEAIVSGGPILHSLADKLVSEVNEYEARVMFCPHVAVAGPRYVT